LTGTPTAPTAAQTVNNTQIATTAFVKAAIAGLVGSSPEALDTLNELAAALGNDPNFATTVMNALAGKQPLDATLTNLSGKSVSALLQYLGLKTAAQRDVGTGTNQIPDMSYFTASLATNGWAKLPNGLIIQQGVGGPLTPAVPDNVINFNISFPNRCLFITEHDIGNSAKRTMIQIGYVTSTAFTGYNLGVLDRAIPSGLQPPVSATVQWFAIGY
ncbi:gp53-like domain-containing protein, partial [Enterobacter hormaechei]|uniref:gp53-like domain-containing protein n=1 Tax=Enterobacter hormaechei TaxID=158836 RepID=UPI0034D1EB6E